MISLPMYVAETLDAQHAGVFKELTREYYARDSASQAQFEAAIKREYCRTFWEDWCLWRLRHH